jgi:hypothetical protein
MGSDSVTITMQVDGELRQACVVRLRRRGDLSAKETVAETNEIIEAMWADRAGQKEGGDCACKVVVFFEAHSGQAEP